MTTTLTTEASITSSMLTPMVTKFGDVQDWIVAHLPAQAQGVPNTYWSGLTKVDMNTWIWQNSDDHNPTSLQLVSV